jgi:DNA replication protein DnaC
MKTPNMEKDIAAMLRELHLPGIREAFAERAQSALQEKLGYLDYLKELLDHECCLRRRKSIERRLKESRLPMEKTFDTFDMGRMSQKLKHQISVLREGSFVERRENVLAFGLPGSGKSHLLFALCHSLIQDGRNVLYAGCSQLVQELLRVKKELRLDKHLKRLERFDVLMIDDIGYVQQSREEMEVLFTLLAARYERGSVMITSNLPFSKWETIFKDPMTTAAAIDRLVHHSVILELNLTSFRMEQAKKRKSQNGKTNQPEKGEPS